MAAPLSTCTMEEQWSIIHFFVVRVCKTFWNLQKNEGSLWTQLVWVRGECMNGWKDFKTEDKTSVMNTGLGDQLAWQLRKWNSRSSSKSVTTGESLLMKLPQNCHGSVYSIVHDDLRYREVCSRWVPRQLSDDHKRARQTICQGHLGHHAHRIVTGDESWVYHYEPESKRQSMQW
jgi:hypothetical protein